VSRLLDSADHRHVGIRLKIRRHRTAGSIVDQWLADDRTLVGPWTAVETVELVKETA
jgi:hypothetical protein